MCVSVSPLSQSIFPPIFPHSHTHTDTESTHTGQRQADFIYRHYMYPTDMFLALHRFQHRHGYAEKQTHTPDTHTHRRTQTHTRTLNFQFRLPRQAPRLPPPPLFSNLILSLEKMNFALFVGIFSRFLVGQYILVDVAKVRRALW